ncbi:sulfatase-like hydrolase/transferase [Pelagicoccus enzymogenes]|uniref:sulfatase-like hydrolase/transferase n=1 Tax=Pelagicoccus enzymogenes TaxID=2773457 RepID=UPI001CD2B38B|nr:sulfatase-like hydrolase/transferase [Pelagicoccus enzymogenes]
MKKLDCSRIPRLLKALLVFLALYPATRVVAESRPNFVIIYTDDHRWDAVGASRASSIQTPNIDRLSESGRYFPNSFVSLSICAPSRASLLTGYYGSTNGVMDMESALIVEDDTLAERLAESGYETSLFGKWHLSSTPERLGFAYSSYFYGLVPYWDVTFMRQGEELVLEGFVDDATTRETMLYLDTVRKRNKPFFVCYNSFAPHMDNSFAWPARESSLELYPKSKLPYPSTWEGELPGKPPYLKRNRPRQRALEYGYADLNNVLDHIQGYYASVTDMDAAVGELLDYLRREQLEDETYIILMGDNGWFNAEHGLTSKVLPYEESIRVPLIVSGPGVEAGVSEALALNLDIMPTVLELAGLPEDDKLHGRSLVPLLKGESVEDWREYIYYEAPHPQHGTMPLISVRTKDWKYVATYAEPTLENLMFEELYHLESDPGEWRNLISDPALDSKREQMVAFLEEARARYTNEAGLGKRKPLSGL